MTNPSLIKRLEALESVQNPRAPIIRWKPYSASGEALAAFETELADTKAAHPHRPVLVIGWEEAA
jgi:hypothetical protein